MKHQTRIFLTGGTGFIGQHVAELLLSQGMKVTVLSRKRRTSSNPNLRFVVADLKYLTTKKLRNLVSRVGPTDVLVYMAASIPVAGQKKESFFEAKQSTFDPLPVVLEGWRHQVKKIVYTSTIDIYGSHVPNLFPENAPHHPETPYAVAKYCGEKYILALAKSIGLEYVILRFAQVYGPDEPLLRVMPYLVESARRGTPFTRVGSGKDKRRLLYVDDASRSVLRALQYRGSGTFNIAGKDVVNINQIIRKLEKITGQKITVIEKDATRPVVNLVPRITKAHSQLGFTPRVSITRGLQYCLKTN